MSLVLEGKVKQVGTTQTFDSGFSKREFVITTDEKYPQDVPLEVVKDKCDSLDALNVGQSVKVSFNVRGREYNDRHYVNLQAWRVEAGDAAPQEDNSPVNDFDDDDMPF